MMICITRSETDPYFNIAAEEYFLKNRTEDIVMIWQCDPAVIVGKHQNAIAEVNPEVIRTEQLPVIRRLSGGGTVYHDLGNLNYTVIRSVANRGQMIDFRAFTKPIIDFLNELGIVANFEGKNNLVTGMKKFSGNSAHVYRNRVIHHGTILFDSNLNNLNFCIKPPKLKIQDKAVKSIRANVTNIKEHLLNDMGFNKFKVALEKYVFKYFDVNSIETISNAEKTAINSLVDEKYKTRTWNFGYSPSYTIVSQLVDEGHQAEIKLKVVNGLIVEASVDGQNKRINKVRSVLDKILGLPYHPVELDPYLRQLIENDTDIKVFNNLLF